MNKPIHPAVAEHVMEENDRLRGLLRECHAYLEPVHDRFMRAEKHEESSYVAGANLHAAIDAALSQQAGPSTVVAPFDLNEFARRAGQMMAEHDFHGFEPIVLAIAEELLGVQAEPAPAQDEREAHQYAFEVGGTEDGNYILMPEELDEVVRRAREPFEDVLRSLACSLGAGGYNAPTVDPAVFEQKIRWGIDQLTRPAQTEQQALPDGYRLIRIAHFGQIKAALEPKQVDAYRGRNIFDEDKVFENWRACGRAIDDVKDICQQVEWDSENELAELLAAPIAQTAPQPEQSGLVKALQAMLDTYGPPAAVANVCIYPDDHAITKARAALSAKGVVR